MIDGGKVDLGAVDLTERHQLLRRQTGRLAPALAHPPRVFTVPRSAETDVPIGASRATRASGDAVHDGGDRVDELAAPEGHHGGRDRAHPSVNSRAASKII